MPQLSGQLSRSATGRHLIGNGRAAGKLDVVDAASAVKKLCTQIGADKVIVGQQGLDGFLVG